MQGQISNGKPVEIADNDVACPGQHSVEVVGEEQGIQADVTLPDGDDDPAPACE
jgi:hypothetical protein